MANDIIEHAPKADRPMPERFQVTVAQEWAGSWLVTFYADGRRAGPSRRFSTFARAVADVAACTDDFELYD